MIQNHIELPNFSYFTTTFISYFEKTIREFNIAKEKTKDIKEKILINNEIMKTITNFTDMLENFGLKDKIPHLIAFKDFTNAPDNEEPIKPLVIVVPEVEMPEHDGILRTEKEKKQHKELIELQKKYFEDKKKLIEKHQLKEIEELEKQNITTNIV